MFMSQRPGTYSDAIYTTVVTWQWECPAVITAVSVHIAAVVGFILGGVRWRKGEPPSPSAPSAAS
jgi:hypothetical protein